VGLFGSLKKLVKGVGKVAGGVVRTAASIATHGVSDRVLSAVHLVKQSGIHLPSANDLAYTLIGSDLRKPVLKLGGQFLSTGAAMSASPVLPGGAVAPGVPGTPAQLGHPLHRRRANAAGYKKLTVKRRSTRAKASTRKKRSSGRLPKFGSPAWRKKFHLDKPRRRRAA
jgi:hypothetical protein